MSFSVNTSTPHAKRALILGHTTTGMGEKTLALKFQRAIEEAGYQTYPTIDLITWMGELYEPMAKLNYDLADGGFSLFDAYPTDLTLPEADLLLLLSWNFSLAAIFATGLQKKYRTVAKLYAHHPQERILSQLYEPADLVITESLLGSERALKYGLDPGKILYLPHSYPKECEEITPSKKYVEKLADKQGKKLNTHARIIGCVSRFEYGKNCEFAVEAVRRLAEEGEEVVLVLKGNFPENSPYPDYKSRFFEMLSTYQNEEWLLWDPDPTPFPQVLEEYASFDCLLHPSGAEGASHVVVECLGLQKPVIVLNCSTNPSLFTHLATFVKTTGELRPAQLPFYIPDLDDLCQTLKKKLPLPDQKCVEERFHERVLQQRIPLIFDHNPSTIQTLYAQDRRSYSF